MKCQFCHGDAVQLREGVPLHLQDEILSLEIMFRQCDGCKAVAAIMALHFLCGSICIQPAAGNASHV